MLRKFLLLVVAAGIVGGGVFWFITEPARITDLPARTANATNGRTMFFAGGCASCHAVPDQDDRMKLGGGLALASPFGTFYVPNISSDGDDGIGRWTEAQFVTAMQKGTSPAGTHYYPAFPYASYQRMRLDDTRDLFAFLQTVPAVKGKVRDHDLPFPYNIRRTLGVWKFLYARNPNLRSDPARSAQWNRGAYLVNALAHCAECHSPRNALGGIVAAQRFAGGPSADGKDFVPNITQKGLADWSEKDIADFLQSGETPSFDSVSGEMKRVIENTKQLSAEDRAAMATYLKSLPPVDSPKKPGA
jgi:mono/diheme cytochrome c family protein